MRGVSDHSLRPLSDVAEHESPSVIGQPAHHERYHHCPWRGGGEEEEGRRGEEEEKTVRTERSRKFGREERGHTLRTKC